MAKSKWDAKSVAVTAIMIAVVIVLTLAVRIPVALTRGYFNLCDVGVYFAAFAFGPVIGFLAGGFGGALADIIGGYPQWAIPTLIIHGCQGLVAGYIGRGKSIVMLGTAWLVAAIVMIGGYMTASFLMYGPAAVLTDFPIYIAQNIAGLVIGVPLYLGVRKSYPQINNIGVSRAWEEEK